MKKKIKFFPSPSDKPIVFQFGKHICVGKQKMCFVESKAIVVQDGDKGRGSVIQFLSPPKF